MLTKSDFLLFMDAPMHLWAQKHNQYNKTLSQYDQHLIKQGYEVEKLAREYVKKYISADCEYQKIYQTDDLYSRADIVVGNDIYEVKSVTEIEKVHEYDVLFQYYTASNTLEKDVNDIYLIYLNKEYIKEGDIDLEQLFIVEKMTNFVKENYSKVEGLIAEALLVTNKEEKTGLMECYKPKDCPCKELCFPTLPEYSIYDVGMIGEKKVRMLRDMDILDMRNIPENFKLSPKQQTQVKATKENQAIIDTYAVKKDIEELIFPIYFLDYETYSWAVPRYDGHRPYQNVVFQYSLHVKRTPDAELEHYEYLSTSQDDPMKSVPLELQKVIGKTGSILTWNKSFEMGRNKEMGEIYPEYEDFFIMVNSRIKDLGDIFSKQMYVDPKFKGSWSIKKVLPVICPDLTYHGMEVSNGTEAMVVWEEITYGNKSEEEKNAMKENLLRYCELDTYAMIRIWEEIKLI
ncbi:MAG: hypothetical protein UR96_C0031G0007 [candidate division WS6 bacterium GW2011_GWC1_36_11]|uniref:DUF2779 domain-containing protein n=3 Tax=Candidatus Dojkabacteria TaxID=74243 RepID=A0A0G0DR95_9BACT|nr:MAG: hypothetical protein UR96_C0031G0007 [candidate division WS6 bacterium GW2011_GWC1_36_11]KKQ11404.1 MAG: hypothetical protein US24_C0028G0004 [candidate division WS6 bacterium GW2011_GWC2_36_7]KKQ15263.1 MAG: hypothetical protein US29_C0047G0003 [candidate division WS6 bacterium GW2011_GWF1_36_8]HAM37456.1 hypothetical protein [Patescibacteria group bacterium]HAM96223.1 hypothetical protein [Patescibacteria group bacterium]